MHFETSDDWRLGARQMLAVEEGAKAVPYDDKTGHQLHAPVGNMTIGVGRNLDAKPLKTSEIVFMLDNDIDDAVEDCKAVIGDFEYRALCEVHQYALINMAFALGRAGLDRFTKFKQAIREKRFRDAADHVIDSLWAKQAPNRVHRVAEMLRSAEYPAHYLKG